MRMRSKLKISFEISERKILLRIFDILFVLTALKTINYIFDFNYFEISVQNYYWTVVLIIYLLVVGTIFEIYNLQVASNQFKIIKNIILTSTFVSVFYLLTPIYTPPLPSQRLQLLFFFLSIVLGLLFWRLIYQKFFASYRFSKNVIIVCESNEVNTFIDVLSQADPHYHIIACILTDEKNATINDQITLLKLDDIESFIYKNRISEIVVASRSPKKISSDLYNKLLYFLENGIQIREFTQVYESITHRIPVHYVNRDFYRYFPFSRSNQNKIYQFLLRFFEICFSILGLIGFVVLLPLVLIGNLFFNRGGLFYTQERVGKNGKIFIIYKFRSMINNAEKDGIVFATGDDSRITPFGKILRKTRIDEFPQFLNILKGDMAIIGPRPERPFFVDQISELMPFYQTRHVVKPGLTGWAQVNYSYGESVEDSLIKLQYDLYYIKHKSIFLDINIVFKTISTVLFFRGQ